MKLYTCITTIFLLFAVSKSTAQNFNKEKLDQYFNTLFLNSKFMGNVAVHQNGKTIYTYAGGYSNIVFKTEATTNTEYRIGSVSKTITATLVLKAVEEGKLTLAQTIDQWFPNVKNAGKITIHNLLNHHSGIHSFTADADYVLWNTTAKAREALVTIIANGASEFAPGTAAKYSNANYILLSYILEDVYQTTYAQLVEEKISNPLHLKSLRFGTIAHLKKSGTASYTYNNSWQREPDTHPSIPMGAGSIITTATDLATFVDALFQAKIINTYSLQNMLTFEDQYGLGMFQFPFYSKTGYGHNGKIDGYESVFCYFPEEKISYVLLSNGVNYNLNNINIAALCAIFNMPYELPVFTTYPITVAELQPYLGVYTSKTSPLVITISNNGTTLQAQPEGQPVFIMEAIAKNKFKHDQTGVTIEFDATNKTMTLKQSGQEAVFTK